MAQRGLSEEMGLAEGDFTLAAPLLDLRADGVRVLCVARCSLEEDQILARQRAATDVWESEKVWFCDRADLDCVEFISEVVDVQLALVLSER